MKSKLLIALAGFVLISSCRKDPSYDQLSSNLVVFTIIDTTANFSNYQTYYISDSIAYISSDASVTTLSDNDAQQLVTAVKQNMQARGFQLVGKSSNPDIGINMGIVKDVDAGVVYPGWWGTYSGWWSPGYWGWTYPYYYPWSVAYVVTSGTIGIDMIDLKDVAQIGADGKHNISVLWSADMSGALGNNTSYNVQNGVNAINQAFTQSPAVTTK